MQKNKVKVKLSPNKLEEWNNLLGIVVNDHFVNYSVMDEGRSLYLYPDNEHMFSIRLNIDGTWTLE